jgi:hypothetical protein
MLQHGYVRDKLLCREWLPQKISAKLRIMKMALHGNWARMPKLDVWFAILAVLGNAAATKTPMACRGNLC